MSSARCATPYVAVVEDDESLCRPLTRLLAASARCACVLRKSEPGAVLLAAIDEAIHARARVEEAQE